MLYLCLRWTLPHEDRWATVAWSWTCADCVFGIAGRSKLEHCASWSSRTIVSSSRLVISCMSRTSSATLSWPILSTTWTLWTIVILWLLTTCFPKSLSSPWAIHLGRIARCIEARWRRLWRHILATSSNTHLYRGTFSKLLCRADGALVLVCAMLADTPIHICQDIAQAGRAQLREVDYQCDLCFFPGPAKFFHLFLN